MNKKDYKAVLHAGRSAYGVELDIMVPDNQEPVIVAQDVFGESEELLQVLVYPAGAYEAAEVAAAIRFNDDGGIAEIVVPDGVAVRRWDDIKESDWLARRDRA